MKFKLISDVHEELMHKQRLKLPETNEDKEITLIVAGDLNTSTTRLADSLSDWSKQYKRVIFVLGNHDYWGHYLDTQTGVIKSQVAHLSNVHVLENEYITVEGVHIWGSTLWSDCTRDPTHLYPIINYVMDFKRIKGNIKPHDITKAHQLSVFNLTEQFLRNEELQGPKIVVTHHAPCELSSEERFKGNEFNSCFFTDLTTLMYRFKIDYWLHGHMHNTSNYKVHNTRVLCNPVGYVMYPNKDFQPKFVEELK